MKQKIITTSPEQTKELGGRLARRVLKSGPADGARIFGLRGELGSGKTTFVQGFAKALGIRENIASPTYLLVKRYALPVAGSELSFTDLYHIDCYRLQRGEELLALDWADIRDNPASLVLVEWPEKIEKILPLDTPNILFEHLIPSKRRITPPHAPACGRGS